MTPLEQVLAVLEGPQPRRSDATRSHTVHDYSPVPLSSIEPELAEDLAVSLIEARDVDETEAWEWCTARLREHDWFDGTHIAVFYPPELRPSRTTVAARLDLLAPSRFAEMTTRDWPVCPTCNDVTCICRTGRTTVTVLNALAAAMRGEKTWLIAEMSCHEFYLNCINRLGCNTIVWRDVQSVEFMSDRNDYAPGAPNTYWTHEAVKAWGMTPL